MAWILLGGRTRAQRIPGRRSVSRRCEACDEVTVWVECDVLDRIEVFLVPLLDTRTRRFVCLECGDDLDPADLGVPRAAPRRAAPRRPDPLRARRRAPSSPAGRRATRPATWRRSRRTRSGPTTPRSTNRSPR